MGGQDERERKRGSIELLRHFTMSAAHLCQHDQNRFSQNYHSHCMLLGRPPAETLLIPAHSSPQGEGGQVAAISPYSKEKAGSHPPRLVSRLRRADSTKDVQRNGLSQLHEGHPAPVPERSLSTVALLKRRHRHTLVG